MWAELGRAWVRKARRDQNPRLYEIVDAVAARALGIEDDHEGALRLSAMVAQDQHDFERVAEIATRLVRRDAGDATSWGLLGDASLELGKTPEAIDAYQKMMDLYPGLPSYSRVAYVRWLHGDVEGSLQMWAECAKAGSATDPEPLAYCLSEAGHVQWWRGDLDAAERSYEAALSRMPAHAGALLGRGRVALALGESARAVEQLEASLQARRLEETYVWLIAARRAAGQDAEADEMEARLERAGEQDDARTVSLYLSSRGVAPEQAMALAERDSAQRMDVYTLDALAMASLRNKDVAQARAQIDRALALKTPDPRLWTHAALIYAASGERSLARQALQRVDALNPRATPHLDKEIAGLRASLQQGDP